MVLATKHKALRFHRYYYLQFKHTYLLITLISYTKLL
jgi:hypothetical protein